MNTTEAIINEIVPDLYEACREELGAYPYTDLSGSNQCHILTRELYTALKNRGIESRRELHQIPDGRWHFVIAHTPIDQAPSQADVITDLNPWQYNGGHNGYLHADRLWIQKKLGYANAPAWFVSLRGVATITKPHTEEFMPH